MRFESRHVPRIILLTGMLALSAFPANAVTVVSVAPGIPGGPAINSAQSLAVTWTSTVAFSNVTISAYVSSQSAAHTAATAYLTTRAGAGATTASLVAFANVTLPTGNYAPEVQLFSGLSLPPGTYYLILATADTSGDESWSNGDLPTPAVTAPGVTFNGTDIGNPVNSAYPPASSFGAGYEPPGLAFDVTSAPLVIPHVVDGGGWQTTFGITNTTESIATATLQFYQQTDNAGDTQTWPLPLVEAVSTTNMQLAPGATVFLQTTGTASALTQGFGELIAGAGVQGYAIFTWHVGGSYQDGTALAAAPGGNILVPFDNSSGIVTGIAVVNASGSAETLSANLLLASGQVVSGSLPSISSLGHTSFTLPSLFPQSAGQEGTLELSSSSASGTFSVVGLRFHASGAFTSLPVYTVSAAAF